MGCGTGRDFLSQIRKAIRSEIKNESNNYMKVTTGTVIGVNSGKATIRPPFGPSDGSQDYIAQIVTSQNVTIGSVVNIAYWCNLSTAIVVSQVGNTGLNFINRNLLDNWYFVGGGSQKGYGFFPINQYGKTNYTTQQTSPITIDRWHADWNLNLDIADDGILMSGGGIFQYLSEEVIKYISGKTITISALFLDGNLVVETGNADEPFGVGSLMYRLNYGGGKNAIRCIGQVMAIKLEIGDKQTLCYQNTNGEWKLFEVPDYYEELTRCQQQLRTFNAWTKFSADYIESSRIMFSIPGNMCADPIVSGFGLYTGLQLQTGFSFDAHRNGNNVVVVANKNGHGLTSAWLGVSDKAYLSAEL